MRRRSITKNSTVLNITLVGNPNVGKSTIFNSLTGLHQHTGNWPGKTVENITGEYSYNGKKYEVCDLPGTYSLEPNSAEEEVTSSYIRSGRYNALIIILDATCIQRNLRFAMQILKFVKAKTIICINLIDEAEKKGITVNSKRMSEMLGVPVIKTAARDNKGLEELRSLIECVAEEKYNYTDNNYAYSEQYAEQIFKDCCNISDNEPDKKDRMIDRILISKRFGIPAMILILCIIFFITIWGANVPSQFLMVLFEKVGEKLTQILEGIHCPGLIESALIDGVYTTVTWIIAVMLPPMAIFFPLFTLLEDSGYLPRIAFNLDSCFQKAGAHGKQSLTIAMGFGCNACAVTGCRIIDSPRERLIAILTNSFTPCNGRFPMLIAIISMFMLGNNNGAAAAAEKTGILIIVIAVSLGVTLLISKLLSKTVLKGIPSSFVLELPPYRRPQFIKVIIRSIFDRTLFVLGRAVAVAAPAGLFIWVLANIKIADISVLVHIKNLIDPVGIAIGLDGAILMAFFLGLPANEIVLPIILMIYLQTGSLNELPDIEVLKTILIENGWTFTTAICTIVFSLFHFPCSTTLLTIHKETKSIKWTLASFIIPLLTGVIVCLFIKIII